ncbi:hypothetical protein Y032_0060g3109 [Ancylostoma ceylanicum]|uniref:Uncharacterized protein n=1 Tax=Ancylostoma ceylanicum TaxID=53326 RepID=A0A016U288_9BILA|nr:hypothetical protein Y032_0060g3109 [Ancylostoma ceylanicum]
MSCSTKRIFFVYNHSLDSLSPWSNLPPSPPSSISSPDNSAILCKWAKLMAAKIIFFVRFHEIHHCIHLYCGGKVG